MSQVIAYLPSGFSNEDKAKLIHGVKQAFCEAFGFQYNQSNVMIEEYRPEDVCPNGADKMALLVYTTVGKTDDQKEHFAKLYDQLVTDVFGEKRLGAFITFEEHTQNNIGARGKLVSQMKK